MNFLLSFSFMPNQLFFSDGDDVSFCQSVGQLSLTVKQHIK